MRRLSEDNISLREVITYQRPRLDKGKVINGQYRYQSKEGYQRPRLEKGKVINAQHNTVEGRFQRPRLDKGNVIISQYQSMEGYRGLG
jgi:hypothetical protein